METTASQTPGPAAVPVVTPTPDLAKLLERLGDSEPSVLIADLDAGDEAIGLIGQARGAGLRVLAFGPHVRKDLFQQARDAGASEVMTNGSFGADLPEVLLRLAGRG